MNALDSLYHGVNVTIEERIPKLKKGFAEKVEDIRKVIIAHTDPALYPDPGQEGSQETLIPPSPKQ